jgi:NAD(P)-dependent dehydrogenase (short-subunit alcohol dehydrogenase family)
MTIKSYVKSNTESLSGKTVAVTGATGGLGKELVRFLASLGANLILMDRNRGRSEALAKELCESFPDISVELITVDLADIESVKRATEELKLSEPDVFIHNAGAYSIPRCVTNAGFDNVFQINFVSPYYMIRELLPVLRKKRGRAVAVGSIAHNYSKIDENDIDFKTRKRASLVYGNAKRYLTYALHELFKDEKEASLAISHPGISFTNITAHYPKLIFAIIKHPMKLIFMKPKKACLSILKGVFEKCEYREWIGPRFFNVWGLPKKKRLNTASDAEIAAIGKTADKIFKEL